MIITIASGKGGTGKTTITVNLASVAQEKDIRVFDCDVEEPNAHLFIKPDHLDEKTFTTMIPTVDLDRCNSCGECEKICQFSAISLVAGKVMTFPEMCHSCYGCLEACPEKAISEGSRTLGKVIRGKGIHGIDLTWGELRIGEAMSPPLIEEVKSSIDPEKLNLVDAPPGTSCPAMAALKRSDFALLVAEPTPFGLNDLALTVEALKLLKVPTGIVINRADPEQTIVDDYARKEGIEILQRFPFSREAAQVSTQGHLLAREIPEMKTLFQELYTKLLERTTKGEFKHGGNVQ